MYRRISLILILIIVIFISACEEGNMSISDTISPPTISKSPLDGIWQSQYKREVGEEEVNKEDLEEKKKAYFYKDYYFLNGKYNKEVNFVAKNLNAKGYLPTRYTDEQRKSVLPYNDLNIISIYKEGKLLDEVILLSNDEMVLRDGDSFIFYKKIKEETTEREIKTIIQREEEIAESKKEIDLGLLLGIREEVSEDNFIYKSIYISIIEGEVSYYYLDDIAVPFRNGFYKLEVERTDHNDRIILTDYDEMTQKILDSDNYKIIHFIGNSNLSYESVKDENRWLGLYPINQLQNESRIKIDSVLNKNDLNRLKFYTRNKQNYNLDEYNFGLTRKEGSWVLVSRETKETDKGPRYKDYELNITPPESLVKNFNFTNQLSNLNSRYNGIEDIFTSPNGEIVMVQWQNRWVLYEYEDSKFKSTLLVLDKKQGESVVLEQWATEGFVKSWSDEIKRILENKDLLIEDPLN